MDGSDYTPVKLGQSTHKIKLDLENKDIIIEVNSTGLDNSEL